MKTEEEKPAIVATFRATTIVRMIGRIAIVMITTMLSKGKTSWRLQDRAREFLQHFCGELSGEGSGLNAEGQKDENGRLEEPSPSNLRRLTARLFRKAGHH